MTLIQVVWLLYFCIQSAQAAFKPLGKHEFYKGPEYYFVPNEMQTAKVIRRLTSAQRVPYTMETGKQALVDLFGGYAGSTKNLNRWGNESARAWTSAETDALRGVLTAMEVTIAASENNPCAWELVHCYRGDDVALYAIFANGLAYGGSLQDSIGQLTGLRLIKVAGHELTGTLPVQMGDLSGLEYINLGKNNLEGAWPKELSNCRNLFWFEAPRNKFVTQIPIEWYQGWPEMLWFSIYGNDELSGRAVPPEIKYWKKLEIVGLSRSKLSGEIAQELGELTAMVGWWQSSTPTNGAIPFGTFGTMKSIGTLEIDGNEFSGQIPVDMLSLPSLTGLNAEGNKFSGTLGDMSSCLSLVTVDLTNNKIEAAGGMPSSVKTLLFKNNKLKSLPSAWYNLSLLEKLDLSNNEVSSWPMCGVYEPIGWEYVGFNGCPANQALAPRFSWPKLKILLVSGNPLNLEVRDFLHSLGYLPELSTLEAKGCQLRGEIPMEIENFIPTHESIGDEKCVGRSQPINGFQALLRLVLSNNAISGVRVYPPPMLTFADISGNRLSVLHDAWWNGDGSFLLNELAINDNPSLRAPVLAMSQCPRSRLHCPSSSNEATTYTEVGSNGNFCPAGIPNAPCPMPTCLISNPIYFQAFDSGRPPISVECTSLCRVGTGYTADSSLNSSMLCRCKVGFGGQDKDCVSCPWDTYSSYTDDHNLISRCLSCPANSNTFGVGGQGDVQACICNKGFYKVQMSRASFICAPCPARSTTPDSLLSLGATTVRACQCDVGYFAESNASAEDLDAFYCKDCPAFSNTTSAGATKPDACLCKDGVVRYGVACGCSDDTFMNHALGQCQDCMGGQNCLWKNNFELSLLPPNIEKGFWAETHQGRRLSVFSGYDIYRCFSKSTCKGTKDGSVECAVGRHGKACSLCAPGYYGGFDGECNECSTSGAGLYVVVYFVGAIPIVVFLILLRSVVDDNNAASAIQQLRSMRVTFRQLIKYFQMLGIIANFEVRWPSIANDFLSVVSSFSLNVNNIFAVSCVFGEQTVWSEMGFRWAVPFVVILLCIIASLMSPVLAFIFRKSPSKRMQRYASKLPFNLGGSMKLAQVLALLFFSSLIQSGFIPLNCAFGPNKVSTIVGYPHVDCYSGEWWEYFFPTAVYILLFGPGLIAAVFWMAHKVMISLGENACLVHDDTEEAAFQKRGKYKFVSEDFRESCVRWGGYILLKDFSINVIGCAFASDGTSQLLLSATVYLGFTILVVIRSPFMQFSNSVMECWVNMSLFVICVFSCGMGFHSTPDLPDVSDIFSGGEENPAYKTRTLWLFVIMIMSVAGPAAIFVYQCFFIHPRLTKPLPTAIKGISGERRKAFEKQYTEGLTQELALATILQKLDDIEFKAFHKLMMDSPSTLGILEVERNDNAMKRAHLARSSCSSNSTNRVGKSETKDTPSMTDVADDKSRGPETSEELSTRVDIVSKPTSIEYRNPLRNGSDRKEVIEI